MGLKAPRPRHDAVLHAANQTIFLAKLFLTHTPHQFLVLNFNRARHPPFLGLKYPPLRR